MAVKSYQIPFDRDGNMLSYPEAGSIMKDNYEFVETLTYRTYERGRSSATIVWEDSKGKRYSMFLSDLDDLIRTVGLDKNKIKAKWTFGKKGQNYGIKLTK